MPATRPPASPRKAVIDILCQWDKSGKPVDLFFNKKVAELTPQDLGLVKRILYGVLRQRDYLDHIIARLSRHSIRKMKPLTINALRVGAYQLLFMDRIPESAAVNETVRALKKARQPQWLIRFVNGVLRNVSRQRESLPGPDAADQDGLPVLNHPQWLCDRWQNQFGRETMVLICRNNNLEPPLTLRVNTAQTDTALLSKLLATTGIAHQPGRYCPESLVLTGHTGPISSLTGYDRGLFQVQDEAAQLASLLLPPFGRNQRILDACAGLGGKTSHLAQLLPHGSQLVAVEPDARRCRLLRANLERLQLNHQVDIRETDLQQFAQSRPDLFDAILLDAPCSGTGVIRRQPDIRWNRHQQDLHWYQAQQLELLTLAVPLLRPSGKLVYTTCSLEPEENQEVIAGLLAHHPELHVVHAGEFLPGSAHVLVDDSGFFRPNPTDGLDGFFGCCLCGQP